MITTRAPILIVEDNVTLARLVADCLDARGYVTRSAGTVAEALDIMHSRIPALVLIDVHLPDGSGWDVLRAIRARGHFAVAAIVMSGQLPDVFLVNELDCVGTLMKPFQMSSLLRLVADSLGEPDEVVVGKHRWGTAARRRYRRSQ